jgi:hypothetical protein
MLQRSSAPAPRSRVIRRIALGAATLMAASPTVYFVAPASAETLPAHDAGVLQQVRHRAEVGPARPPGRPTEVVRYRLSLGVAQFAGSSDASRWRGCSRGTTFAAGGIDTNQER